MHIYTHNRWYREKHKAKLPRDWSTFNIDEMAGETATLFSVVKRLLESKESHVDVDAWAVDQDFRGLKCLRLVT